MRIQIVFFVSILFFCMGIVFGQEKLVKSNFAIRDFDILGETLVYIQKRDLKCLNLKTQKRDTLFNNDSFFIGGYGLKLFYTRDKKRIITASNELIRNISSIRFFNTEKKEVNKYEVLYEKNLLDFFAFPKDRLLFLSRKDNSIQIYKYGRKLDYNKLDSLKLDSFSRKIYYDGSLLYYITDSGKVVSYDLIKKKDEIILTTKEILVNFIVDAKHKYLYASTFSGKILKVDLVNKTLVGEFKFGNKIIEAIDIYDDRFIIAGDWNGIIKIIDTENLFEKYSFNNKKRIIKIKVLGSFFYTSGSGRHIKRWRIE